MFGGMQLKAAAAPAAAAPVAPPTSGNLLDGLNVNETSTPAPTPAKPAEVIDMFGHLSVKSSEVADEKKGSQDADDLGSVAAAGSAFGFINAETSNAPAAAAQMSSPQPTKESFDPMSNFSPNTQRQMMQVSQEQMQAMAYQQMMMQQQYQQQQMMMMAMQQGGGMPRVGGGMQMMPPGMQMQRPGVMGPHAGKTSSGFSFLDNPATKKVDHSFDFVQDTIKAEKTHK
jgi:hypothetical protein